MIPKKNSNFARRKFNNNKQYGKIEESICIETVEGESH